MPAAADGHRPLECGGVRRPHAENSLSGRPSRIKSRESTAQREDIAAINARLFATHGPPREWCRKEEVRSTKYVLRTIVLRTSYREDAQISQPLKPAVYDAGLPEIDGAPPRRATGTTGNRSPNPVARPRRSGAAAAQPRLHARLGSGFRSPVQSRHSAPSPLRSPAPRRRCSRAAAPTRPAGGRRPHVRTDIPGAETSDQTRNRQRLSIRTDRSRQRSHPGSVSAPVPEEKIAGSPHRGTPSCAEA